MNTEGCVAPFATDELLLAVAVNNGTTPPACDANLAGFASWLAVLTLLKFITGVGLSVDWYMRYRSREGRARLAKGLQPGVRRSDRTRYPLVPMMNLIQALIFLSMLVFASTGACSSRNGCGLALFCIGYLNFCGYSLVLLKQFVALGKRMIPLARSKLGMLKGMAYSSDKNDSSNNGSNDLDALSKEDSLLRILIILQVLCAIIQAIIGAPIQVADGSPARYELWLSLSFGFQAGFYLFNMLGFLLQLQRLIYATEQGCTKPYHADVRKALSKMRHTQVGFTLMHLWSLTFTLLIAVHAIPARWFIVLLMMSSETAATTLTFVKFALGKLMAKSKKQAAPAEARKVNATSDDNDMTQGTKPTMARTSALFSGSMSSPAHTHPEDASLTTYASPDA